MAPVKKNKTSGTKKQRSSQRTIALYVSLIALSTLLFLFLSVRSLTSQWRVLLHPGDSNLQSTGQTVAEQIEAQANERAVAYLNDSELQQVQALAAALPNPVAARQIRQIMERVSKRNPIGKLPFVVRNGSVEFPMLKPPAAKSPQTMIKQERGADAARFAAVFQAGQRQQGGRCSQATAKSYSQAGALAVSPGLRGLAQFRLAGCYRDQKESAAAEQAYRELSEHYGDEYDPSGVPYALVAEFELEELRRDGAASRDRYLQLYRELNQGRWELSAATVEALRKELQHRIGNDVQDSPTEFLNHLQAARVLQESLRRKADPKLSVRVSGGAADTKNMRAGDVVAYAFTDKARSYQSYYRVLSASAKEQLLVGFTVDMDWVQREMLPEFGAAGAFVVTYKGAGGDSNPHADFAQVFPFWQLSVTPSFVRSSMARADLFVAGGSLLLAVLGGLGIVLLTRDLRQQREYARMRIDFVNGVSHELKTPITLIRLYAETLLGNPDIDSQSGAHCEIILREAERLTHLVEHILDFSRGEKGLRQYEFRKGDLAPVVESVLQGCRDYLSTRQFTIGGEIRKDLPSVNFDAEAIPSLVINLVDNAVKYSGDSKLLRVQAYAEDDWVVIEVEDNGIGIPPSEREKIFEPYYRVNTGMARGGCGLGLSLVKNIMEAHGGKVIVLSEVGRGTKFKLLFPIATEENTAKKNNQQQYPEQREQSSPMVRSAVAGSAG